MIDCPSVTGVAHIGCSGWVYKDWRGLFYPRDLKQSQAELQEKILDLEKFEEVVVGRELKMIALEKELENLRQALEKSKAERVGT